MELRPTDPNAQTLSLAAGLALAEAVDVAVPSQRISLKWPNDLITSGKKLAGILLERSGDRVAVGFGVNLAHGPDVPGRKVASLGRAVSPQAFASILAASFARLLEIWRQSEPQMLAKAWLARAHPLGTPLAVHVSTEESIAGRFDGIEPDGALRLRREDGAVDVIRAGDVEL